MAETVPSMPMPESSRSPTSSSAPGIERRRCHSQSRSPSALALPMARSCRSREVMVSRSSRVITVQPYPAVMTNLGREYEARCVMFSAIDAALDDGVQRRRHHPPGRSHRRCALAVTALAGDVDTQYVYTTTTDGSDLTDVYGPLHAVQLATGPPA